MILVHLNLLVVNNGGVQTLGVLDVDGLHVGVQLLLGILLVVTLTRDAHTQTEGNTLDTGFPDLLVQLGVETDVLGALDITHGVLVSEPSSHSRERDNAYHSVLSEGANFLDSAGSTLLESNTVAL